MSPDGHKVYQLVPRFPDIVLAVMDRSCASIRAAGYLRDSLLATRPNNSPSCAADHETRRDYFVDLDHCG
jgi:hypothetical protein